MPLPAASSALMASILGRPLLPSFNAGRPNLRPVLVPLAFARSIPARTRSRKKRFDFVTCSPEGRGFQVCWIYTARPLGCFFLCRRALAPDVFEPTWRQRGITHGGVDRTVAEVGLQG